MTPLMKRNLRSLQSIYKYLTFTLTYTSCDLCRVSRVSSKDSSNPPSGKVHSQDLPFPYKEWYIVVLRFSGVYDMMMSTSDVTLSSRVNRGWYILDGPTGLGHTPPYTIWFVMQSNVSLFPSLFDPI